MQLPNKFLFLYIKDNEIEESIFMDNVSYLDMITYLLDNKYDLLKNNILQDDEILDKFKDEYDLETNVIDTYNGVEFVLPLLWDDLTYEDKKQYLYHYFTIYDKDNTPIEYLEYGYNMLIMML
jgi:hypothetical protein